MLQFINFVVAFAVITLLFAMIFKVLPDVEIGWHDVWVGAAMTSFLFGVGKYALGLYLGRKQRRLGLRRGGKPCGFAVVDLLRGADSLFWRRIHAGLRQKIRLENRAFTKRRTDHRRTARTAGHGVLG